MYHGIAIYGVPYRRSRRKTIGPLRKGMLATLRKDRQVLAPTDPEAVQLLGSDGAVCVQRLLACTMSPVLRAALTGPYSEAAGTYNLLEHTAATILFAVEFMLGGDDRINGDNSMPLLALSEQLNLAPLKAACEAALLRVLVTSNAAELADAAVRFGCVQLQAAADKIQSADTSVLGDLIVLKSRLVAKRTAAAEKQATAAKEVDLVDAELADVVDKEGHELEQIFRAKSAAAAGVSGGQDDYPYAASTVVRVLPNASNPFGWLWDRKADQPSASDSPHTGLAQPKKKARVAGGRAKPTAPSSRPVTYTSIMEAYSSVGPGSVIKLAAGRHMISDVDHSGKVRWPELKYRKSVQIVADDGLSPEQVLIGTKSHQLGDGFLDLGCVLPILGDIRLAGVTCLCTNSLDFGMAFFTVEAGGKLWLENCALKLRGDASLDPKFRGARGPLAMARELQVSMGVRVEAGGSAVIRDCIIKDADGPGVEIDTQAGRVLIERTVVTGCGRGPPHKNWPSKYPHLGYYNEGERGAIELLIPPTQPLPHHAPHCQILLRGCTVEGNYGPGVSWRPLPVATWKDGRLSKVGRDAIQSVFTLDTCVVKGNGHGITVRLAEWSREEAVVCNVAKRGENGEDDEDEEYDDDDDDEECGSEEEDGSGEEEEEVEDGEEEGF